MNTNFNLFGNLKGQARQMQRVIKDMSPKVKDIIGFTTGRGQGMKIDKGVLKRKMAKFENKENSKFLQEKIKAVLADRESKEAIYDQQDKLSKESVYGTLLDQFMEDAFGIDPDDDVVNVEIINDVDPELREILEVFPQDLLRRTHIEEILTDYLKNTYLKYGELFLRKHFKNNLLVRLEVMDGKYVYPICNGLGILFFIVIDPVTNDFEFLEEDDILAFQLNPQLKHIVSKDPRLEKLLAEQTDEFKASIPDAYKMGTPLLYNARNELTKLRIANLLTDLAQLKSLAMPTLLAVNVENIRDEEQLSELLDTYEEYLEDIVEVPDTDNLEDSSDITSLMNTAFKVLPVEGSGKNGLTSIDFASGASADSSYLDKKKDDVVLAAGFPLSALTAQSDATSKSDLASNRRYRNKCKGAQRFIVRPLHTEVLVDFAVQNIDVSPEQVRVFCKPIVSLDSAEDLEISLGAITNVSQVFEALEKMTENNPKYEIDWDGLTDYFNGMLSSFKGTGSLFKKREEEDVVEEDNDFMDDESSMPSRSPSLTPPSSNELNRVGLEDLGDTSGGAELNPESPTIEEAPTIEGEE